MPSESTSFETARIHHGIWRWKLETSASNRLVQSWSRVASTELPPDAKNALVNVAWSLASLERSYHLLVGDARRAQEARDEGVPAVMKLLTGAYENSLEYLLIMSLWMDLGDVLAAYRTTVDRFGILMGPVRRGQIPVELHEFQAVADALKSKRLPSLSVDSIPVLANRILHQAWHPTEEDALALTVVWKKRKGVSYIDFADGPVRDELTVVVEETVTRVSQFLNSIASP